VDEERHIRWISVTVTYKATTVSGFEDRGFHGPTLNLRITKIRNEFGMNSSTPTPFGESYQPCMGYIPSAF